jgi:hypothetical protein
MVGALRSSGLSKLAIRRMLQIGVWACEVWGMAVLLLGLEFGEEFF